ncbi:unnamed protein product [Lactuca saligna]|uniref:SWIM-type domain-containing protein n=1 Tax=Lactuca saligna TaxID=75948 RepID=A0AA35Z5J8_LACSI|nr:unnamed protein product [Lactuca saligna]
MDVFKELLPQTEYRKCARHIVVNFSKKFLGEKFVNKFWSACNATIEQSFKEIVKDIELLSPEASNHLIEKDPRTWSRAYYQVGRCCSSVENGGCESFNAVIVEARKKPIITMLEELRMYMMNKLFTTKVNGWSSDVSPEIRLRLNELRINQRFWEVLSSGLNQFETRSGSEAYDVDLDNRTCSCTMWQVNGYGCVHSMAAISYLNKDVEKYVDPDFCSTMYMKTYQYKIYPMNGSKMWPETNYIPPLPPKNRTMHGRPKTKKVRDVSENGGKHKVSKKGKKISCSLCKMEGHNKKTCPNIDRSRPKKLPTMVNRTKAPKGENMKKRTVEVASSSRTGMDGGDTHGSRVKRNKTTKVKRREKSERIIKKKWQPKL